MVLKGALNKGYVYCAEALLDMMRLPTLKKGLRKMKNQEASASSVSHALSPGNLKVLLKMKGKCASALLGRARRGASSKVFI